MQNLGNSLRERRKKTTSRRKKVDELSNDLGLILADENYKEEIKPPIPPLPSPRLFQGPRAHPTLQFAESNFRDQSQMIYSNPSQYNPTNAQVNRQTTNSTQIINLENDFKETNCEKTQENSYEKSSTRKCDKKNGLMYDQNQFHSRAANIENKLCYQRQLSKSVGDNLQQCKPQNKFNTFDKKNHHLRQCLSAGDLLGKTHEELLLLLIQLKRNQSQLRNTIEKLSLQMESEEKLSIIEPHKVTEHQLKFEQVKEQLIETQKQYENQFPLIDLIDNMVKLNTNSKSNLIIINGSQNEIAMQPNQSSASTNNVDQGTSQNEKENCKDKRICQSNAVEIAKGKFVSYFGQLNQETSHQMKRTVMNDESDYACETDTNNLESTYTNRSSCLGRSCMQQRNENQEQSINSGTQEIESFIIETTSRNLEIPPIASSSHKKQPTMISNVQTKCFQQSNSKASEQTSSQATNTLSNVISSVKRNNATAGIPDNLQVNQHLEPTINQESIRKSKVNVAEEEMNHMKEQQILLEAELERVRKMLMNSQSNSQLNVSQQNPSTNLNDDLSIVTTTENHFQAELENIDKEINNLNAKKEKLIQSLKRKEYNGKNRHTNFDRLEDGTDLFTDDDAIFSTTNSIDFERMLDDGLSLCTDVDDLELSKHENEYVNTLKAEYEQNLKQQLLEEEERKKSELLVDEKREKMTNINEDETTTETTIYKTLRLVKRGSKLSKQLTFDSGDVVRIDNVADVSNESTENKSKAQHNEKEKSSASLEDQKSNKSKINKADASKVGNENELIKSTFSRQNKANNLLNKPSIEDDHLLPSEISQLLLDSALIIYEQLKPPKRSTGSSVSSERSIDDQVSDEENLDVIQPQSNIIKHQPKVSSISATIPTLLELNRDLSRDLNRNLERNLEREINSIHHHHSAKLSHHRTPPNLIDNRRLMRELMFDSDCGLSKLRKETKIDSKLIPVNGRSNKLNKKKSDKSGYSSNLELEEERTRIF